MYASLCDVANNQTGRGNTMTINDSNRSSFSTVSPASPTGVAAFDRILELEAKKAALQKKRITLQRKIMEASNRSKQCSPSRRAKAPRRGNTLSLKTVSEEPSNVEEVEKEDANRVMYALELEWKDSEGKMGRYTGPITSEEIPHGADGTIRYYDDTDLIFEKYEGHWKDGKKCGYGVQTFSDGSVYEGDFDADLRQGKGIFRWARQGNVYEGEWNLNLRHGRGIQVWVDGRKYHGDWKNGVIEGRGVFEWQDGATYEGQCAAGKKHGRGIQRWKNGKTYKGDFIDGNHHGYGTLTFPDGRRYRGDFSNNHMHGMYLSSFAMVPLAALSY
jgi:hypothetical protein